MAVGKTPLLSREAISTKEEVDFKAAFFHDVWIARKKRGGQHFIDYHNNPMVSPPPLRADGKSRCDDCCLLMAPFSQLTEAQKESAREIVWSIPKAEDVWRNRG